MPRNAPEDALRGFYTAILRDQDFDAAARFASPGFHLRPNPFGFGLNVNAEEDEIPSSAPRSARSRPSETVFEQIHRARGGLYPFAAWRIDEVTVDPDGRTAEAVTDDGSAGLEVIDDEWRVSWVLD